MAGTTTAFGTTANLYPLLTPPAVDNLTTTNTCPGTFSTSDPGIWFDVPAQTVSVAGTSPYLGEIPILTVPNLCMAIGFLWYEIWLTSGGYMCGMESISFSSGLSQTVNMSLPNVAVGPPYPHYRAPVVNPNDPIPTGLIMTYGNPWGISITTGFTSSATPPSSYTITGGRVCFMGMMYSNP